jgi:arylsulfatase A-like enzyme
MNIPVAQQPKNVIVLLLDSLNRHELGAYGGTTFDTPNIDRLAARSLTFTNHTHRIVAVHPCSTRHLGWCMGFFVEAVGLD